MAAYFVQHGLSLSKEEDPKRSLSAEGRNEVEKIALYLKKLGVIMNNIYHSGKTRAEETAEIFAKHLGCDNVRPLAGINPMDDVKAFAPSINFEASMYVGHLPHLEKLVGHLIAGDESRKAVKFTNGGVVCLDKDELGVHLDWSLKPSLCLK